jgi:hypothetical protein
VWRRLLGISPNEATFARRGFDGGDPEARRRLETIGSVFLFGYHTALEDTGSDLSSRLDEVEADLRGFAYEGAAMGLALLTAFMPWRWRRLQMFLQGPGDRHSYMVHVGLGWALAASPVPIRPVLSRLDPLLRWLAVDGFGFYHGYFAAVRHLAEQRVPRRLKGYACRVFDQGLGRALWFAEVADVDRVAHAIARFPERRQADLWSGVGLACTYAGGAEDQALAWLRSAAGRFRAPLGQGASFAAKARQRAGNPAPHTDRACVLLCGVPAEVAARVTDDSVRNLPTDSAEAYETWRERIQNRFIHTGGIC